MVRTCTLTFILAMVIPSPGYPHDVYQHLYSPTGQLCCGGDPVSGDCEALSYEDIHENPDGSWTFISRRYKTSVLIGEGRITWLPVADSPDPVHWCGVPRAKINNGYITAENPDPSFWSYCAFIAPGGV